MDCSGTPSPTVGLVPRSATDEVNNLNAVVVVEYRSLPVAATNYIPV